MSKYSNNLNYLIENRIISILIIVSWFFTFGLPHVSYAQTLSDQENPDQLPLHAGKTEFISSFDVNQNLLPEIKERKTDYKVKMTVTAYSSTRSQTDDSPCVTASGLNVCERNQEDIVATNFNWLSFGTKIKIPELFGDKVFTIHDRMNTRYTNHLDIWHKDYTRAIHFGAKHVIVEIY